MAMNDAAVVLVHGAWADGSSWARVVTALKAEGAKVGILDADIYGPSQPRMLGTRERPTSDDGKHMTPILAEVGGRVKFVDIRAGETMREERDVGTGATRFVIMEHKGDLHPQVVVEDPSDGKILDFYYMPERAHLEVDEGQVISPGTLVAKTPREATGTQDITGG